MAECSFSHNSSNFQSIHKVDRREDAVKMPELHWSWVFSLHTSSKDIENTTQKIRYGTTMTGLLGGIGFPVVGCTVYHFWMGHPRCLPQAVQRQWGSLLLWMTRSGWCHLQQPADQPIGHASASLALTVVQSGICWSQKWHCWFGLGGAHRNSAPDRHPLFSGSEIHIHKHKHSSTRQTVSCKILSDVPVYIHILPVGGWGHAGRSPVTLGCWEAESHFLWVAALRETQLTVAALGTLRLVSVGKFMLIFKSHKCGSLLALSL